ncbi:uncharacterized protein LOC112201461 [Rosa chinensis]|uniref:uncharacterized protein LOC112201461 n=1 Tax=Rosa chinensis TaxID=74649 RepID=UPI000D08A837|nr:uncharacterized protein LOC112201461 [Rosa chinensis]
MDRAEIDNFLEAMYASELAAQNTAVDPDMLALSPSEVQVVLPMPHHSHLGGDGLPAVQVGTGAASKEAPRKERAPTIRRGVPKKMADCDAADARGKLNVAIERHLEQNELFAKLEQDTSLLRDRVTAKEKKVEILQRESAAKQAEIKRLEGEVARLEAMGDRAAAAAVKSYKQSAEYKKALNEAAKAGALANTLLLLLKKHHQYMALLGNPKHMALSLTETTTRLFVTRFLRQYRSTGCLILLEEGGKIFNFEGSKTDYSLKSVLKVHSPQFYWKVMTQADLGIADAYISGDFSFDDKDRGLLNLFMLLLANGDSNPSKSNKKRGWWQPLFFTATIATAKYVFQHALRKNSLTQARRNISRHYDLSNELFSLFLGETMMYSTAIFKTEDEELNTAKLRKISTLIDKLRIDENHEVLDIGCGWGTFTIEAVKQTGCRYTGITLSEEQLKFAKKKKKAKDAGLQDRIKFLLCDYRQLPFNHTYDRIISCEMLEHVGHEFVDEFFSCCESLLAENGIFVLQFISILDELYDQYRRSPGFMKEYMFPGGCLLSLSRVISAMATSSRLCVEHMENIGIHYYQTLRCWRKNFLDRQR